MRGTGERGEGGTCLPASRHSCKCVHGAGEERSQGCLGSMKSVILGILGTLGASTFERLCLRMHSHARTCDAQLDRQCAELDLHEGAQRP